MWRKTLWQGFSEKSVGIKEINLELRITVLNWKKQKKKEKKEVEEYL